MCNGVINRAATYPQSGEAQKSRLMDCVETLDDDNNDSVAARMTN
jgi:hypothetical protein